MEGIAKKKLTIIDIISEKHNELRKFAHQRWIEKHGEEITYAEGYLLFIVHCQNISPSGAAKIMRISRQAAHKCALRLAEKGYLSLQPVKGNKKDKCLILTPKGEDYYQKSCELKIELEKEIETIIGSANVARIKELFSREWVL